MAFGTDILLYILIAIILVLTVWIIRLDIKLRRFTKGKSGENLEEFILETRHGVEHLAKKQEKTEEIIENINTRVSKGVRGIETIRFNPFKGTGSGGNQSFASALINEEGDGVVISSLYSRERVSIFAKPIKNYKSEYELSKEEKEAIAGARV